MKLIVLGLLASSTLMSACVPHTIRVNPVRVEPIHMTVDVNIHDNADASKTGDKAQATDQ